ncbi:flagellar hook-basal body complex protein [Limnohabitans sp. 63ED37-2]|uniref:flagellar hook-basal body complex protein n=1 Tax=Limnohabitans sp. 63ED37-2 TaxID=1678128 RepID=UPI000706B7AC|nr:flagellar hook-basal body complex protein [Limnohabitans sp. 63ED37-2]ALK88949.1 Flagellar hook protein FlgE [Limnohabitans sp. 63ED37-2]
MSFYTSLTGLNSATAQLAVTSNNIANVGTSGFKRSRADFGDIFSTSPLQKSSSNIGQGVSLKQVSQEFSQGNISTSGNSLDLAITGDGFFPLKTPDGLQDIYTRNGSFTLNDQNNVVNSTGQRLMAASVDSSGKADLTNLNALTIPSKTSGEAVETTKIQLGLNLPADSAVITADFDRSNASTYNKSTALTVYDSGGNGYLATVYYVKTQNATMDSPFSKWQSYFFVGDTQVKPALQQATDTTGSALFVNKYGDVLPKTDSRVIPSSGTTEMYSLDELTDIRPSSPATVVGNFLEVNGDGNLIGATPGTQLSFNIKVDDSFDVNNLPEGYTTVLYTLQAGDSDPDVLAKNLEVAFNNVLGELEDDGVDKNARFGITVSFDPDQARFSVSSGTTGDGSSIHIYDANPAATSLMGLDTAYDGTTNNQALRGKASEPAVLSGEVMTINTAKSIQVTSSNKDFFVSVDGIAAKIDLPYPTTYTNIEGFAKALQDKINSIVDPETGRKVLGVTVAFDPKTKQLNFTTGTTGNNAAIQVSGAADWGLANTEMQFGTTTEWKKLTQFTENGAPQFVKNGEQTEDGEGVSDKTEWWPVYLDRGELSFDLTGKPVSPLTDMPFETAFLQGGKGALTMSIDFTKSTQYSSAFAVLSQSQDGAPEGELMGLNINPDGLVNATYSNGSQVSLGKIVLANFSSPSGLRQVGDASYLASASSGMAKIGEAGSAGFGSIRAGATERANVDLTQELVDLITAQRNFQANAKAIETSSTMTSAIINIRS